jgi:uridine phosphorylase
MDVGSPNGILDDVFIGDLDDSPVAYASVYGAPMASEIVHVFGVLGTPLVLQTGCCGALADDMDAGDLFIATVAFCGEGASQYYKPSGKFVSASVDPRDWLVGRGQDDVKVHTGRIYTTSALFAEGMEDVGAWCLAGFSAVDMETATTFSVAEHFNMDRASVLFVFDNPRRKEHVLLNDIEKHKRRTTGDRRMVDPVLRIVGSKGHARREG